MIRPDTSGWTAIGRRGNSTYFVPFEGVLVAVPDEGCVDTAETARENQDFQHEHFRKRGRPGVILIYFDLINELNKDARDVYTRSDPKYLRGVALVGGSLLSRAMASFFMGIIAKPLIPLRMFGSTEEALKWARELDASRPVEESR
jgi:hypothetical protein